MKPRTSKADATVADVSRAAVALLARREHGAAELRAKLIAKGYDATRVDDALAQLRERGLQSDARFAESYARTRAGRGFGAARVAHELRARGMDDELIANALTEAREDWRARIAQVRSKKFGEELPRAPQERARQARFLLQRGFTAEQVRAVLRGLEES
jgi:regulatory protein